MSCCGLVLWMGALSNLTHTECQECGAINNQDVDQGPLCAGCGERIDNDTESSDDGSLCEQCDIMTMQPRPTREESEK